MRKLLLITIAAFLSFSVQAQKEKKIYESDIFSIQYPSNWSLDDVKGTQAIFVSKAPLTSDTDIFAENVNIITQNLKGMGVTLDQYVQFNESQLTSIPNGKMFSSERETRDGRQYHTLIFRGTMNNLDLKIRQVYAIKDEIAYVVTFTTLEDEFDQLKKVGAEILSSFKLK